MYDALIAAIPLAADDWQALWLTLRLAALVTLLLWLIGTPLAWWLARCPGRSKHLVAAIVALPLVLPPSVLGFYLLLAMGPDGPLGHLMKALHLPALAFSFGGLVLASMVYSLPFMVQPLQNAFEAIGDRALEVAATLRASPRDAFFSVVLPQARPGIITAIVMTFAHTLGEFGVVLMIGGNIPGVTRVASIQIYNHVETMSYDRAHWLAGIMLALALITLLALYGWRSRRGHRGY